MSRIYQKSLDKCSTFSSKPVIQYFIIKSVSCFFFFDETLILALALNNRDGRNKTQRCTDCKAMFENLFKIGQSKRVKMKILFSLNKHFLSKEYQVLLGNCPSNFSKISFGNAPQQMENWWVFS